MEDKKIIQLFWNRDESAIPAAAEKYGAYCSHIAANILKDRQDCEECVSDTWLQAWNSIPPQLPQILSVYLGKITRNLAFDRYRYLHREKRGGSQTALVLEELGDCVSGIETVETEVESKELTETINAFLAALPEKKRNIFLRRYWYNDSVKEIALRFGMRENSVSMVLLRLKSQLKEYLRERGLEE